MLLNAQCPICLENLGDNQPPMATQCGHLYCLDCATFNFATKTPCASCRKDVKLGDMIRIYPNYTGPDTSSRIQRDRPQAAEAGDEIMESARQLLAERSMQEDDAEAVVHSAEGFLNSVHEDTPQNVDVRPLLRSLGTVFSELRSEIQRLRTLKEAQLERDQIQIQQLLQQVEREKGNAKDEIRKRYQVYKQRKAGLEEEKRVLQDQLDKARQSIVLATTQLQSNQYELARLTEQVEQLKTASLRYRKKYHALRQSQRHLKQNASVEIEDDLEVV